METFFPPHEIWNEGTVQLIHMDYSLCTQQHEVANLPRIHTNHQQTDAGFLRFSYLRVLQDRCLKGDTQLLRFVLRKLKCLQISARSALRNSAPLSLINLLEAVKGQNKLAIRACVIASVVLFSRGSRTTYQEKWSTASKRYLEPWRLMGSCSKSMATRYIPRLFWRRIFQDRCWFRHSILVLGAFYTPSYIRIHFLAHGRPKILSTNRRKSTLLSWMTG